MLVLACLRIYGVAENVPDIRSLFQRFNSSCVYTKNDFLFMLMLELVFKKFV